MPPGTFQFTTGPATLQDVGRLSYNGVTFSPLFATTLQGKVVKDEAGRTTKLMEYVLTADGYVTLPIGFASSIAPVMLTLRKLLTAQSGNLIYSGRGFDLNVNPPTGAATTTVRASTDVAWGPVPELIEFQPLGAGRSAKVQWKVTVRIPENSPASTLSVAKPGVPPGPILQLNYETGLSYGEDGFTTLSIRGTLEIPLTRPAQGTRTLTRTVDEFRAILEDKILRGISLDVFRVTRRDFRVSRDKRTLEWDVEAEERPYMDMPPDCTIARGTFSVRPAKLGVGLVEWLCTLKATYIVRAGEWRRSAWISFLTLLRLRMLYGFRYPKANPNFKNPQAPLPPLQEDGLVIQGVINGIFGGKPEKFAVDILKAQAEATSAATLIQNPDRPVWIIDFTIEEGLYLDSKTISFSATWRLISKFAWILMSSGTWRKVKDTADDNGKNLWALSMKNANVSRPLGIQGSQSWLLNQLDPNADMIVDFGGP